MQTVLHAVAETSLQKCSSDRVKAILKAIELSFIIRTDLSGMLHVK